MTTVGVDVGGTFTDFVFIDDSGSVRTFKLLTSVTSPERSILEGVSKIEGVDQVIHASTVATNALRGQENLGLPKAALLCTKGFRDVIEIGRQNRAKLYDLSFNKPRPLIPRGLRIEIDERTSSQGTVLKRVDEEEVTKASHLLSSQGVESVAIAFLNSYLNQENELIARSILQRHFRYVTTSSEVAPEPREYERTSTAVVNAVLMPLVSSYLERLKSALSAGSRRDLYVMSSSGGLVDVEEVKERPIHLIESGPAAGAVATAEFARMIGEGAVIGFDVGGTTAKGSSVFNFEIEITGEYEVGGEAHHGRVVKGSGYPVRSTFVDLAEVSAGGGTIIKRDEAGALRVGPLGAGSDPGPICYGRGGTVPTVTDANLLTGIIPDALLGGEMALYKGPVVEAFKKLGDPYEIAEEALRLAYLEAARSIRLVTVERGLDPSEFSLFAFGGAGPQFAPFVAEELGIKKIIVPPYPGVFSALGLLMADWKFESRLSVPRDVEEGFRRLEESLERRLGRVDAFLRYADVRYVGQGWELVVPLPRPCNMEDVKKAFESKHLSVYGIKLEREIELVTLRVFGIIRRERPHFPRPGDSIRTEPSGRRNAFLMGERMNVRYFRRLDLSASFRDEGPLFIDDYDTTIVVPAGWVVRVGRLSELILERS
ncbi:MAG: hydantoinase/oxoprolinase family protein [Aigarchaeota archaeon]|nr:hydantoinase/oxoprolinase family protein [Aigarchaeota archaeon]MDW8092950.1 hydantoinase/oxoprolinase family protein [Nitrososphaerota archaeon]